MLGAGATPAKRHKTDCAGENCNKFPSFGIAGSGSGGAVYCFQHAEDGMVNVVSKQCEDANCQRQPTFGMPGTKIANFCAKHKEEGMINVRVKRCAEEGCSSTPTFAVQGSKTASHCIRHMQEGMMNSMSVMRHHLRLQTAPVTYSASYANCEIVLWGRCSPCCNSTILPPASVLFLSIFFSTMPIMRRL